MDSEQSPKHVAVASAERSLRLFAVSVLTIGLVGGTCWLLFQKKETVANARGFLAPAPTVAVSINSLAAAFERASSSPNPAEGIQRPSQPAASVHTHDYRVEALFDADAPAQAESWKYRNAVMDVIKSVAGVSVNSLECRQRICRLQVVSENSLVERRGLTNALLKSTSQDYPNGLGAVTIPVRTSLNDGRVASTVFLARVGELDVPVNDEVNE